MSAQLTVKIPVRDRDGRVIEEKEVATYAGLLARAHEEGLQSVTTRIVQIPSDENRGMAIVEATVTTSRGTYTGIGDANPENVNRKIVPHLLRMAETRAKARAFRDAVNIGIVALEELGGDFENEPAPARSDDWRSSASRTDDRRGEVHRFPARGQADGHARGSSDNERRSAPGAASGRTSDPAMTENQRRWIFRNLAERGFEGSQANEALCRAANVREARQVTKRMASDLIDRWQQEAREAG